MNKRKKLFCLNSKLSEHLIHIFIWIVLIEIFIFIYDSYIKNSLYYYSDIMCIMDYLEFAFDSYTFQLFMFPYTAITISILSDNLRTANYIIRYRSKKQIVVDSILKGSLIAFVCSLCLIISLVIIGGLFSGQFFNWDKYLSYFYMVNSQTTDVHKYLILLYFFYKSFISISFFSILIILFQNLTKNMYAYIAVILMCIINFFDRMEYIISKFDCSVQILNGLFSVNSLIVYFIIIPILNIICCYLSVKTAIKKDYYCE